MSSSMTWNGLPYDGMEVILSKLPLFELAQMSWTCKTFRIAFRNLMAAQQRARCERAFASCGRERVKCLLGLIAHLHKVEPLSSDFLPKVWNVCWISADGVLHGPVKPPTYYFTTPGPGDMQVNVSLEWGLIVEAPVWRSELKVFLLGDTNGMHVSFDIMDDEDFEMVAAVQALLSGGLAQLVGDAGSHAGMSVWHDRMRSTRAGLKEQIAPLLPFASRYTPAAEDAPYGEYWMEEGDESVERMHIGQVRLEGYF
jgi:hypothetical protein